MKTLTLSVLERLQVPDMLPRAGKIIEMELARSVIDKVRLDAKEIGEYGLRDTSDGRIAWDQEKARDKEIAFEESEIKMIQGYIRVLDKEGRVTMESLPLVKKLLEIEL